MLGNYFFSISIDYTELGYFDFELTVTGVEQDEKIDQRACFYAVHKIQKLYS
ncbi:hypothetical protein BH11BAC2_BH11BAC2_11470 [soil metagenome]